MSGEPRYKEQLERLKRWYNRFSELNKGKIHDRESSYYIDEVHAFFPNCYHLKDWIKNDESLKLSEQEKQKVEDFISNNYHLSLCADICNSIKHLKLTSRPRSDKDPSLGNIKYKVRLGSEPTTIAVEVSIDTTDGPLDAYELAKECIHAWEEFIKQWICGRNRTTR